MVQSYPALMFPMAALVSLALDRKAVRYVLIPVVLVFLYFNVWLTIQYHRGRLYDSDCMTKLYFWRVVGRWSAPDNVVVLKDNTELYEEAPQDMHLIYQDNMLTKIDDTLAAAPVLLNKEIQQSPVFSFAFTGDHAAWLRIGATFHSKDKEWDLWKMPQFIVRLVDKNNPDPVVKENALRISRILGDHDNKFITLDMKLPHAHYDSVRVLIWNAESDKELRIEGLKVWGFNGK